MWPRLAGLPSWTLLQVVACVVALLVVRGRALLIAGPRGLDPAWLVVPGAVLGSGGLAGILAGDGAGASVFGAAIGGAAALALAARLFQVPFVPLLDGWAIAGWAALPVSRLGCLLAGCCIGGPSAPFPGVSVVARGPPFDRLPDVPLHAVPLYEAVLVVLAFRWVRAPGPPGQACARVVLAYGVVRLVLDPLRHDIARAAIGHGVSWAQLWAAIGVLVAGIWMVRSRWRPVARG